MHIVMRRKIGKLPLWLSISVIFAALWLAQPTAALAHETGTAHIEPEVIVLAVAIPVVIIAIGAVIAFYALRSGKNNAPQEGSPENAPDHQSASDVQQAP